MPTAVELQAQRANERIAELAAAKKATETPAETPAAEQQHDPVIEAQDQESQTQDLDTREPTPEQKPQTVEVSASELESLRAKVREAEHVLAQHRTLQGKYNAEVPRLSQQIRDLQQQIAEVNSRKPEQQPPTSVGDALAVLRDALGEDAVEAMLDLVRRTSTDAAKATIDPIAKRVETTEQQSAKTAETALFAGIAQRLAVDGINFGVMNNDPEFLAWLSQPDGFSGVPRADVLNRVFFQERDIERAAQIFIAFKNAKQAAAPQPPKSPQAAPANRPDLNKHVQVPVTRPNVAPAEQSAITRAFVAEFFAKKRRGEYTPDEAARIEKQIFAASSAGKVI